MAAARSGTGPAQATFEIVSAASRRHRPRCAPMPSARGPRRSRS